MSRPRARSLEAAARRLWRRLPISVRRRAWHAWASRIAWPLPLWRVRGEAEIVLGGERLRFVGVTESRHYAFWARSAWRGTWEPAVVSFLADELRPGDVVLDVGAFVGPYAMLAARRVGAAGHVHAFEPDSTARALLERNLARNAIVNVSVHACAVSASAGTLRLEAEPGDSRTRTGAVGDVTVPAVTLDGFCAQRGIRPAVIKADIEGGEREAFTLGAARATMRDARAVVVEIHEDAGVRPDELATAFATVGKRVMALGGKSGANYNVAFVA
ncbi:MAG: FkbM family methyltransferase [Gemmatimonadaceae bacterium]